MIKLYFDGGCTINPGGIATSGVVIYRGKKRIYTASATLEEKNTSCNVVEYGGLIIGLNFLIADGLEKEEIQVIGDSKLVIAQMFRGWKLKKGAYIPYAQHCSRLLSRFSNIKGKLIPREQNKEADALTRKWSSETTKLLVEESTLF